MVIEHNSTSLLMRFNNYKKYSFIEEVEKLINHYGSANFFKVGKIIPQVRIQDVIKQGGTMILKAPKADGDNYYYAHIVKSFNGVPQLDMHYPTYYQEMIEDESESLWMLNSLEGTWFETDYIRQLTREDVAHLFVVSNNKLADDVVHSTRSATMYVYSDINLCVN